MAQFIFSEKDIQQIKLRGITEERIISQIEMFEQGAPFLRLIGPGTIGDGIKKITGDESNELTSRYEEYGIKRVPTKFVPASGAASRMFKTLLRFYSENDRIQLDSFVSKAHKGDEDIHHLVKFMEGIEEFAFFDDILHSGSRLRVKATGRSMSPLRKGDLIFFINSRDGTTLHRLIRKGRSLDGGDSIPDKRRRAPRLW